MRNFGLEEAVPDAEKARSSKNLFVKQTLDLGRDQSGTQEGKVVALLKLRSCAWYRRLNSPFSMYRRATSVNISSYVLE